MSGYCIKIKHLSTEITQDMASKGLGVVYEKCSKEQKDELVSILVETLTTGKRCVLSTDHDVSFSRWHRKI